MKKKLWLIFLILGLLPFIILFVGGIYAAIHGFSGITISSVYYGIDAFIEWVVLWTFIYWRSYIFGIVLIVISLIIKSL